MPTCSTWERAPGVCALFAARHARSVVAVDINPAAVRCATFNALLNHLEARIELQHGDLFSPVAGRRFDLILFNPPFLAGAPKDARDAAWRSSDVPQRFAAELADHLKPSGAALVLLSSFGDACPRYEAELKAHGFRLEVFARRRYINETVTILRATLAADARDEPMTTVVASGEPRAGTRAKGRLLLINPKITARRHARFPLSIMTIAAALEQRLRIPAHRRQRGRRRRPRRLRRGASAAVRRRRRDGHGWAASRDGDRSVARAACRAARSADRLGRLFPDVVSRRRAEQRLRRLRRPRPGRRHVRRSHGAQSLARSKRPARIHRRLELAARRGVIAQPRARVHSPAHCAGVALRPAARREGVPREDISRGNGRPATRPRSAAGSAARSVASRRCSGARRRCRRPSASTGRSHT